MNPQIHPEDESNEKDIEEDEADRLPEEDLGAKVDVEEGGGRDEVEKDVTHEGTWIEGERAGEYSHGADDEGGDEGAG